MQEQKLNLSNNLLGLRLDKVLTILISGLSLRSARRLCENGQVFSEYKGQRQKQDSAFKAKKACTIFINPKTNSDNLELAGANLANSQFSASLVYKDADFAVVYKPSFLHSVHINQDNSQSLEALLPSLLGIEDVEGLLVPDAFFMLSRLDYATSGLVPIALNPKAEANWKQAQEQGLIRKNYLAIVEASFANQDEIILDFELDISKKQKVFVTQNKSFEANRRTIIKKLADLKSSDLDFLANSTETALSLVQASIFKGVRHQIRANLAYLGHSLLNDSLYGARGSVGAFYLQHYEIISPYFTVRHLADWAENFLELCE